MLEGFISNYVWIQLFGAVGYGLFAFAGCFKKRWQILASECLGCTIVGIHWIMLGAPAAAYINIACAYAALSGALIVKVPKLRHITLLSIPISALLVLNFGDGTYLDFFIFFASVPGFCAKYFHDILKLRGLTMTSGAMWLVLNVVLGSVPGVMCSIGTLACHGRSFLQEVRAIKSTKALSPAL